MKPFASLRPLPETRCFRSEAVERCIESALPRIADPELAWLFAQCFPNTLDTTVRFSEKDGRPDTFVITGDIPSMWLRDSTAQVWPYLSLAREDEALRRLLAGVVNRQAECVLLDPYANAFEFDAATESQWMEDGTDMKPGLHERKYELDSLCAVLRLSRGYYDASGDLSCFGKRWLEAMDLILATIENERNPEPEGGEPAYCFSRPTPIGCDTLPLRGGKTYPAKNCGLSRCGFRPSDDAVMLPYLIPANAMAAVELKHLARLFREVLREPERAARASALAAGIGAAVLKNGQVEHAGCGRIYAYEVDGFGSWYFMDDANVPSLLSLPYLGFCESSDPVYQNTRRAVLGPHNPYYSEGRSGRGVGGPHVGPGWIWPMSIIMQAMTSSDEEEIRSCLRQLKSTHGGTGWMHETFWKDDPMRFTREWFAWANTLFGELILHLLRTRPGVLLKPL